MHRNPNNRGLPLSTQSALSRSGRYATDCRVPGVSGHTVDDVRLLLSFLALQGIVFSVRPPKKSWKNIANLSGGEKTLSSLSLVFALHHYKPTPLYVMDEIDAALG